MQEKHVAVNENNVLTHHHNSVSIASSWGMKSPPTTLTLLWAIHPISPCITLLNVIICHALWSPPIVADRREEIEMKSWDGERRRNLSSVQVLFQIFNSSLSYRVCLKAIATAYGPHVIVLTLHRIIKGISLNERCIAPWFMSPLRSARHDNSPRQRSCLPLSRCIRKALAEHIVILPGSQCCR
jgi:hypothetical protein